MKYHLSKTLLMTVSAAALCTGTNSPVLAECTSNSAYFCTCSSALTSEQKEVPQPACDARTKIASQLVEIISEHLGISRNDISGESKIEDLSADSIEHVEMTMAAEEKFGVEIPDDLACTICSVDQFVDAICVAMNP